MPRPCMLVVLDGFGETRRKVGNAIALSKLPTLDFLCSHYQTTLLDASGPAVGLPEGQMGNSEVGHLTLGAGRVLDQDLPRISKSIQDGSFYSHPLLQSVIEQTIEAGKTLHIIGLSSRGGVHSHSDHGLAILAACKKKGLSRVVWHAFLDGRDTPPCAAQKEITYIEEKMKALEVGRVGSLIGRFYAMDRDRRFERTQKAYELLFYGKGRHVPAGCTAHEAVASAYRLNETDEFITPIVIPDASGHIDTIQPSDTVIFFNFRADRARQLTQAITDRHFQDFKKAEFIPTSFVCMTSYDEAHPVPWVLFPKKQIRNHLGEYLSSLHLSQLRVAETEKYAHVTFFFNGGQEKPFELEDRILIPSRRDVSTYDKAPSMSAAEITSTVLLAFEKKLYSFCLVNFANPDMLGHTGNLPATIEGLSWIDQCISKLWKLSKQKGISLVITSDHGNCEEMIDPDTKMPHTAHTTNPVPLILVDDTYQKTPLRTGGGLQDVAPTILALMELPKPTEMEGTSLFSS